MVTDGVIWTERNGSVVELRWKFGMRGTRTASVVEEKCYTKARNSCFFGRGWLKITRKTAMGENFGQESAS